MLINQKIKDLALQIEEGKGDVDAHVRDLMRELGTALRQVDNVRRYLPPMVAYDLDKYPIDKDGYAVSYDPLEQEDEFFKAYQRYGLVVGKSILSRHQCDHVIDKICERFNQVSNGACHIGRPGTWKDMPKDVNGLPLLSGTSLEIYHDDALAQVRQNVRAYLHHVLIWGQTDLWTSFDRPRLSLPEYNEPATEHLQCDQNPNHEFGLTCVQGHLALTDSPAESGAFVAVPGSRFYFGIYAGMTGGKRFGPLELDLSSKMGRDMAAMAQPLPLRQGDLITWDNRTTYARKPNTGFRPRLDFCMAASPAKKNSAFFTTSRNETFRLGIGRQIPDAFMYASKEPRYSNHEAMAAVREKEKLTLLGKLLYGTENYGSPVTPPLRFP